MVGDFEIAQGLYQKVALGFPCYGEKAVSSFFVWRVSQVILTPSASHLDYLGWPMEGRAGTSPWQDSEKGPLQEPGSGS